MEQTQPRNLGATIKVRLDYFKPSGKWYAEGYLHTASFIVDPAGERIPYVYGIAEEVRNLKSLRALPGLAGGWDGPILISGPVPHLILPEVK